MNAQRVHLIQAVKRRVRDANISIIGMVNEELSYIISFGMFFCGFNTYWNNIVACLFYYGRKMTDLIKVLVFI